MRDSKFQLRPIRSEDDAAMAAVIRTVMPSFGACGPGFAINDPEVDYLSRAYDRSRAAFFIVERQGVDGVTKLVGGGGFAPLDGSDPASGICELRKMYFLPEARGLGIGAKLLRHCLKLAQQCGYRTCYLETLTGMSSAIVLYERFGFLRLERSLGDTGHHGCDRFYARSLENISDLLAEP